jgi:hypothetical protein
MNKSELLLSITDNVKKKHPWRISQDKYKSFFGELPREFLNERLAFDNLVEKAKQFKLCSLHLLQVKIEIKLTLDQCIEWEIGRWPEAKAHNILPNDIKKLLKDYENADY